MNSSVMNQSANQVSQSFEINGNQYPNLPDVKQGQSMVPGVLPSAQIVINQAENNRRLQDNKQKCKECVNNSPNLQLEVVSSASLPKGQVVTINAVGLYGNFTSEREKDQSGSGNDGFTYFGSMLHVYENMNDGQPQHEEQDYMEQNNFNSRQIVVNDIVIPSRNQESAEQHRGRHFQIWFDYLTR